MGFHPELIVVLVVALLIFGPKKLPEMGAAIGKSVQQFKKGMEDMQNSAQKDEEEKESARLRELETLEREIAARKALLAAQAVSSTGIEADLSTSSVAEVVERPSHFEDADLQSSEVHMPFPTQSDDAETIVIKKPVEVVSTHTVHPTQE
ncbi:Sec-independent protein translocase subunit TatA/TatB [Tengunoibacter tsumagoiensis]|uniref:Sec-independent protein translocase protein TatA n=1 Tax=Tengunoibacter tsumagoiensis TaxID=2014871 RepID=A0A402A4C6_9CHLR|nr:twin-arginine translocase TatA/TatE family subunit [Tengunoibacter tsumagoiensis]GCE13988.1 hypothetical protein KTT_38470 [Tengunoibacter tsumagoiensis]